MIPGPVSPVPETPRSFGFRMPAEWELHEATWIAWPHNEDDWPGRFEPIPWVYGEIVRKLSQVERVRILLQNDDVEQNARNVLEKSGVQWKPSSSTQCTPIAYGPATSRRCSSGMRLGKLGPSNGASTVGQNTITIC